MPEFWYLPTLNFSLWPCVGLLVVFIPITAFHERRWRRALAYYASLRRDAGASDEPWPTTDQRVILSAQPWLLVASAAALGAFAIFALWALLQWPHRPIGFDLPINPYDFAYLWCVLVMALGAIVIAVAIAVDAVSSPWSGVAHRLRRSIYAPSQLRARLLAEALALDPGLREPASVETPRA